MLGYATFGALYGTKAALSGADRCGTVVEFHAFVNTFRAFKFNWQNACVGVSATMKVSTPFLAYLPAFSFGDDALVLIADRSTIEWLMFNFGELASTAVDSNNAGFVIGNGKPVESDDQCLLSFELNHRANGSELVRESETRFRWILSPSSANHYRDLLSGMSESEHACHQYLDPDNSPPAPGLIVTFGEYEADAFRRRKV